MIILFHRREFPIASGLFAGYSRRFDEMEPRPRRIELREDVNESAVEAFLNFCQMMSYEITADTFADLEQLKEDWEVEQLQMALDQFLNDHARDRLVIRVLKRSIGRGVNTANLENLVRRNFDAFVHEDELADLPIPVLTRVVNYDIDFDALLRFLMNCLERQGQLASVLFRGVDIGRLTFDQIQRLSRAGTFFWGFVNQSVADVINGLANEVVRQRVLADVAVAERAQIQNQRAAIAAAEQAYQERVDHLERQIAAAAAAEQTNRERVDHLERQVAGLMQQIAAANAAEQASRERLDHLQRQFAAAAAAEQACRERVDHLEGHVAGLRQQAAAEQGQGARLEIEVNGAKNEIELLRSSLILVGSRCLADQDHEAAFLRRLVAQPGGGNISVFRFGGVKGPGGVLASLRAIDRPFERRVILSQSSRDLMMIVDPQLYQEFNSPSGEQWWFEFRFREGILVNGMRIKSARELFPPSFDICFGTDDQVLLAVRDTEWRHLRQEAVFNFHEVRTAQLKIRQAGPELPGREWFAIKSIEFLSPDAHFGRGIFWTLFNEHRQDIRRFLEVRSRHLSSDELHDPNHAGRVLTYNARDQWLQIEIVRGKLITNCYRLRRFSDSFLKSWSLLGSNDASCPLAQWTELDHRLENRRGENNDFAAFPAVGGPFRYFRLVCTGPTWNNDYYLVLKHIDLYGVLITEPPE
jgi:hypothetical protein